MNTLKNLFPLSFKFTGSVSNLIIGTLIYLLVGIVGGVVIGIVGWIPLLFLGVVLRLLGALIDLYVVGGIVIMFLYHFKVLKD